MLFDTPSRKPDALRQAIDAHYRADEAACVRELLAGLRPDEGARNRIEATARSLVEHVRARARGGIDAFLREYGLSTQEGVVLMCLAEALLRIPDDDTQEALIRDKFSAANWDAHLGRSGSVFVNASTWALMLTGRVVRLRGIEGKSPGAVLSRLVARIGEPVIREAVNQAMKIMGRQFVMGRTIDEALERAKALERRGYRFSYDMLGEAARTMADADRFFEAYRSAIAAIGRASGGRGVIDGPGVSVKLSALHPRYELWQEGRVLNELLPRLHALAVEASRLDIGLTVDAEEVARLDLSLDLVEAVSGSDELRHWDGLGVVVQAYQKRAPYVVDWLIDMARRHRRRLMVRLVKGAYWDAEIKLSQELALQGYPVYTRKINTDVAYLACARSLLAHRDLVVPQFATHNAHSIASVLEYAGDRHGYEFQRLHGMGEELYARVVEDPQIGMPCRIYAPVGEHGDLLPYLVRRLLENGANSSFVNRIQDESLPLEAIVADPLAQVRGLTCIPHPRIPRPRDLYGDGRVNFAGIDLFDRSRLRPLAEAMEAAEKEAWTSGPVVAGEQRDRGAREVRSPADRTRVIGLVSDAGAEDVEQALAAASQAAGRWTQTPVTERAAALRRFADLVEEATPRLMAMAVREAGKTLSDALAEVREAVDFSRYYALQAEQQFGKPLRLRVPGRPELVGRMEGGGVFCCISPWNFPLAIFTGQVTAALAAGNAVVAKPAEQTPLIAAAAVQLMHRAGVPAEVLHLLPGDGARVGGALVADARVTGVCFTGSTEVARTINRTLARRDGPVYPLIAETGGLNAMIVDSSALPEQVTRDVVASAFQSAGQRCSALRVLLLQEEVADRTLAMIAGAMEELNVGDPSRIDTDVGPVIDEEAKALLDAHIERMRAEARLLKEVKPGRGCGNGTFVAPVAFELDRLSRLEREVFGPVLHVIRFEGHELDEVVAAINASGYGLTLGIHTRVDETRDFILSRVHAGNTYVNRNQIGAVVGVQPFGGEGLSGTGPKAGGPHYLPRFASERVCDAEPGTAFAGDDGGDLLSTGLSRERLDRVLAFVEGTSPTAWTTLPVARRAEVLEKAAAALERSGAALGLLDPRGGEALAEAAEYLRLYAAQAGALLAAPRGLPGPTGERNELRYPPRGLVACLAAQGSGVVPLAAQAGAALAAGNAVIVWHRDPRVAVRLEGLLREAGVPEAALAAIPAGGDATLRGLLEDARVQAVAFAGPHGQAKAIGRVLAGCDGAIRSLIPFAVTGHEGGAPGCPLAGSPAYLHRFALERAVSIDTTASGGNASLFAID